jgi:hypothetical protein
MYGTYGQEPGKQLWASRSREVKESGASSGEGEAAEAGMGLGHYRSQCCCACVRESEGVKERDEHSRWTVQNRNDK